MTKTTGQNDDSIFFDISDLCGDDPAGHPSLAQIIADNGGESEMDPDELAALRACPIGGKVNMGIGGGYVTFVRV